MNCRKVSSLLSAYIDRELTGAEMLEIRAHVEHCPSCSAEQESLLQTKRLLSALAYHTPRAELEQLLVVHAEREVNPPLLSRILPPEWTDVMLWRWEGVGNLGSPRMRPLAATAMLSLAGLCLATASVSGPDEEGANVQMPPAHAFAVYVGATDPLTRVPVTPVISDMENSIPENGAVPVAFSPATATGPVWGTMATPSLPMATNAVGTTGNWNEDDLILPTPQERAGGYFMPNRSRAYSFSVMIVSRQHW